jgi:hypothetical protein
MQRRNTDTDSATFHAANNTTATLGNNYGDQIMYGTLTSRDYYPWMCLRYSVFKNSPYTQDDIREIICGTVEATSRQEIRFLIISSPCFKYAGLVGGHSKQLL